MIEVAEAKNLYQAQFTRLEEELANNGQSRTLPIRRAAISSFGEIGFPTTRHEEWKYTNVTPVMQIPFKRAEWEPDGLTSETLVRAPFGKLAASQLVFVNGHYSRELSSLRRLPEGIKVESLATALDHKHESVEPHLARYASYRGYAFVALNTAFMRDGAFVYIPGGMAIEEPVHLLFVSTTRGEATVSYPRNLIVVDRDSRVQIVESYVGVKNEVYLTNAVTEVVVGEGARVEHSKLQWENHEAFHIATLQVYQGRSSNFVSHSITLGGALSRNEVNAVLDGEGSECVLNGLYMVTGGQHVDNHTRIDHVRPHCTSRELYKGVLDGKARGVFNGKIVVHKAAQKTDAKQTNKNLLLSEDASVDTKPQLEIYNNDVKCSHGSTIGQLDQDAIFYLRARGISLEAARSLLTYAFASEIVSRVKIDSVRAQLDHLLVTRLQDNPLPREII